MIPTDLSHQICQHLLGQGYELINFPDAPEGGPADGAIVVQKNRIRYLLLIAMVDVRPYHAIGSEQAEQHILQKQQYAAHTEMLAVTGPPWEITYRSSI